MTLIDLFEAWPDTALDAPLLTYQDKGVETTLSRADLRNRTQAIAARVSQQARAGDRVLLIFPPGSEFLCAFLGAVFGGATAVPLYPPDSRPQSLLRFQALVRDAQPSLVLTTAAIAGSLADSPLRELPRIAIDTLPGSDATLYRRPEVDERSIAYLQYTSGSTGTPRGVVHSHGNVFANIDFIRRASGVNAATRCVLWLPLYHDMGLISSLMNIAYCDHMRLLSPIQFVRSPVEWLRAISRHRGTASGGPNIAYDLCARRVSEEERRSLDLSSWTHAFCGAEPVRAETLDRFASVFADCGFKREAFLPCYGLAEATLLVSMGPVQSKPVILPADPSALARGRVRHADPRADARDLVACGQIHSDAEVAIVDPETRRRCALDEVGEIWVRGPGIGLGYWRRPEESELVFDARIEPEGDGPFLRTGDLGFVLNGQLFVTGRLKDLIVIHGLNYYPQDIESVVADAHPAVRRHCCVAVALEGQASEELAVFFEVGRSSGQEASLTDVMNAVREQVSEVFALSPVVIGVVQDGALPRTSSGKVRRSACRQEYLASELPLRALDGETRHMASAPSGRPEPAPAGVDVGAVVNKLREEIARVVGHPVESDAVITRLGITSVNAIEIMFEIEEEFGLVIEPKHLNESITIEELARRISGETAPARASARAAPIGAAEPASARGPLEFSLMYFSTDTLEPRARFDLLLRSARYADQEGFRSVWIPERHFHPFGGAYPNPSVAAAALATVTERIRLRAGSVVLPLHNPVRVAEEWAFVDNLSQGRVDLSFATGWNPDDFALAPTAFQNRRALTLSSIKQVQRLWSGGSEVLPNGNGAPIPISIYPRPVQPRLNTWLTCTKSVEGFEEAGALGYNVLTALLFQRVEELADKIKAYRSARQQHGHAPDRGTVTLMLHTFVGTSEESVNRIVKPAFKRYLASSADLWKGEWPELVQADGEPSDRLLELGYQRYTQGSSLIGTAARCEEFASQLSRIGVDEIACLIDFGVDPEQTLDALSRLGELRRSFGERSKDSVDEVDSSRRSVGFGSAAT